MNLFSTFDRLHNTARNNRWMRYFTVFLRIALAIGFLTSGFTKVAGERFTSLSSNHPMGHYFDALYLTGFYYTFIGIMQISAAILLLIPRTATLGALIYFPIILNICVLSLSLRFDGSLITSPLMVLANLYLLCWDYDKLKYILPIKHTAKKATTISNKFPLAFFTAVFTFMILFGFLMLNIYDIMPRNHVKDCRTQCDNENTAACYEFCDCIHKQGMSLDSCLKAYRKAH